MGPKGGNRKPSHWVGFDLGGTKMMAAVFDDEFNIRARRRKRTRGDDEQPVGIDRIIETIRQALAEAQIDPATVGGIGVGCPGPVDPTHGIVLEASNLGWRQVDLKKPLQEAFGVEAYIVNDVDVGVYAENCFGAARGARTVVGVFPGTGIGGGCVYNGEIIQGANITCMEIGHMHVAGGNELCGCGQLGCLETVSSRLAIAAEVAKAEYRSQLKKHRPGTDLAAIRSGNLAAAVKAGETIVEQIVRQAAEDIGTALANIIHLLAPDVVVLGGGLVEALPELMVDTITRSARDRVMKSFRNTFRVVPAKLADNATVMGAAAWACHQIDAGRRRAV